jgi:hypothetical protein
VPARGSLADMPWSVRIATAMVAVVVVVVLAALAVLLRAGSVPRAQLVQLALYAAVFVLLLAGLVARRRVAWLWGRYLGFFLFTVALLAVLVGGGRLPPEQLAAVGLGFAGPLLAASVALGRRSALAWFGLVCPGCDLPSTKGDVLMRRVRCARCGSTF